MWERGGKVPSDGTSFLLTPAQMCGSGTREEQVAMESVHRIRLSRAPRVKYEYLLSNGSQAMGRASEYSRRAASETDRASTHGSPGT